MNARRYSFRVVIEQDAPEQERDFGLKEGWAEVIKQQLNNSLHVANVVSVEPIRNRRDKFKKRQDDGNPAGLSHEWRDK